MVRVMNVGDGVVIADSDERWEEVAARNSCFANAKSASEERAMCENDKRKNGRLQKDT